MKHLLLPGLVSLALLIGSSLKAQHVTYPDSWSPAGFNLKQSGPQGADISFSIRDLGMEEVTIKGEKMVHLALPGSFLFNNEGCPNLPGDGRMIAIPNGAAPVLSVVRSRTEVFRNVDIEPAPRIPNETESGPLDQVKNPDVYGRDQIYPAEPVILSPVFKVRGIDVVMLGITPFQYNPVTRELTVYRDLEVHITFAGGTGQFGEERFRNRYWDPILEDALLNHASLPAVDYDARPATNADDAGCEYLIITPTGSDFVQWADSIRRFRIRQGITTMVKTLADVGGNTTTAIENYINNAYNTWNPAPAAVLLLGDYGTDASNSVISPIYNSYCVSDNIYGDVDGDHLPDVCMARITANNAAQLQVMISKFLNYERNPPTSAYFYQHPISALGWQTERWFQICSEVAGGYWKNVLLKDPIRINEVYSGTPGTDWSTATNTSTVVSYFGPSGQNYIPTQPSSMPCCWTGGNATAINTAINTGAFCLLHRDHGAETGWGEPSYSTTNISGLTNVNNQLPFIFSINCLTGKYNYSSETFTEKFHRYTYNGQNSGALGLIAASEVSYSFVNDTFLWGMMDNFWPDFMPTYGTSPASRGFLPCFGHAAGKYFLAQSSWPYNSGDKEVTYNLFHHHGDAFSVVYSEVPQALTVVHDPTINANENSFAVTANAGSLIALSLDDQLLGTATGTGSPVTISFVAGLVPGQLVHVTVTKQNYFRYEADVEVTPSEGAYFIADSVQLCAGLSVDFSDLSGGTPTAWSWSFPGGTPSSSTVQHPQNIVYSTPGTYDVALTITTAAGPSTMTRTGYIHANNVTAGFSASPTTVVVGNTVTFTDQSTCMPSTWNWSFTGGTPSAYTGQTPPPVLYNTVGTYNVTLTVTNAAGTNTTTKTGYITVTPPIFNMSNGTVTTCTGDFYDTGGSSGVYSNNEVYVMTFYPATPGAFLRFNFTSFSTESGYDTLTIYNGPSSAATLIGKYHGSTGPGIVTSTHSTGALTFRFRSDVSQTSTGWAASISCVEGIIADPGSFIATASSSSQINLNWTKNSSSHDVMIVWAPTNTFGTPADGTAYQPGNTLPGGGTVLYKGSLTTASHLALNASTTYYYKAFSCTSSNAYSAGLAASASTYCGVASLPVSEAFSASTLPNCWTKQISGTGAVDKWTVSNTTNAGGVAYEMKSMYQNINPAVTRLVTPPINTIGQPFLNLSFKHMLDSYGTGCTLRIQSSTDGVTWTNEAWSVASTSTNITATTVNTTVTNNMNSPTTLVAFVIEGNLYQYDYWYVDNVTITSGCTGYSNAGVSITSSQDEVCDGTTVTFTASPVNGGTSPSFQWKVNEVNAGSNTAQLAYTPANGDVVKCLLTSNATCVTGNPATSNALTMTVNPVLPVSITIEASANPVSTGVPVTFAAAAINGGALPVFQWKVNGISAGTNSDHYSYAPSNGDVISCSLVPDVACPEVSPVISNNITMTVSTLPATVTIQNITVSDTSCFDALQTLVVAGNNTLFTAEEGSQITMIVGMNILYFPGTHVDNGAYLAGYIAPGGPWCNSQPMVSVVAGLNDPPETPGSDALILYPNPTTGTLSIRFREEPPSGTARIRLLDMTGSTRMVRSWDPASTATFSIRQMTPGIYLVVVENGQTTYRIRVARIE
ncbi:MAG TPA: C25 family cysteine peptidase [Bacteroidales bacterium]|nr:C25 family cysteine peptidase [Bacteroidales bacterium]